MGKGGAGKACKKRITFDKAAVIENCKIKNTHSKNYIAGADVVKGAVCKGAAVKFFI